LKAWELHDCDLDLVKQSPSESIVLASLPKRLAIFIQRRDDDEQLKDCAENWVWLPAVSTTWFLDKITKTIEIPRRGFAIVPDFASTIHGATGRTLPSAIIDIGAFKSKANPNGAMEGMIGMSRVKRREHVVIARPFPPGLFRQGPAVFPTLLLTVLNGHVRCEDLDERLKDADDELQQMQASTSPVLLKNMKHMCGTCGEELEMRAFVEGNKTTLDSWSDAVERDVFLQGVCATCLACKKKEKVDLFRCARCGIQKDMMSFGRNAKSLAAKNTTKRREEIICSECLFPSCDNPQCPRCKSCLESPAQRKVHVQPSQIPRSSAC